MADPAQAKAAPKKVCDKRPLARANCDDLTELDDEKGAWGARIGDRVTYHGNVGTVQFYGVPEFKTGIWIGIELDEPLGKNDGSVNGVRYFQCEPNKGIFAKPEYISPVGGDFMFVMRRQMEAMEEQSKDADFSPPSRAKSLADEEKAAREAREETQKWLREERERLRAEVRQHHQPTEDLSKGEDPKKTEERKSTAPDAGAVGPEASLPGQTVERKETEIEIKQRQSQVGLDARRAYFEEQNRRAQEEAKKVQEKAEMRRICEEQRELDELEAKHRKSVVHRFLTDHGFHGVNESKRNMVNITFPLHRAAKLGDGQMVEFLLKEGADLNQKNSKGHTALEVAQEHNDASGATQPAIDAIKKHLLFLEEVEKLKAGGKLS
mmetsp:Transcript_41672/g.89470  ORF Transcript_41672/g.89470 Transcript_41672/m.89470 type:complete len:380 (-) Transcript_41672:90-1229(-)|eukprot:CAMPEP_0206527520 /NCGR_PEP_ID=MMETSP0325_2-20121206/1395_1 /ASSEMBLY_ACC=CAM_ASM_000347 /TAXON_ID=2866 /ORGANISM="Crypthecodinium cohnii, Strain Seligo" /LENGTH=379 /DNA_ID=CAMNT_0054022941 /DNA_START=42 /DNA_END=1181 /DNA_ORIENTATION=-